MDQVEPTQQAEGEFGDQLRRERLVDMELRLAPYRRVAFAVLAVALIAAGPWLGWWWMIPLVAAGGAFVLVDRYMLKSGAPELWVAAGWAVSPLMIALSVALTGAADSPAIGWFALPAVTLASRFERRGTVIGGIYIGVLLLASTVALDPAMVVDDPSLLIFAVALVIATMALAGAVVESDREHRHSSIVDPLTGLFNRTALAQRVAELSTESEGERVGPLGILVGDLDHFKAINDAHGHAAGDAVLADVAYAITGALRSRDTAYRIGGEEFLILLPEAGERGIEQVGERLREVIATCSRPGMRITMSLGGACADGEQISFSRLSAAADEALYEAKRRGRDRLHMAAAAAVEAAAEDGSNPAVVDEGLLTR